MEFEAHNSTKVIDEPLPLDFSTYSDYFNRHHGKMRTEQTWCAGCETNVTQIERCQKYFVKSNTKPDYYAAICPKDSETTKFPVGQGVAVLLVGILFGAAFAVIIIRMQANRKAPIVASMNNPGPIGAIPATLSPTPAQRPAQSRAKGTPPPLSKGVPPGITGSTKGPLPEVPRPGIAIPMDDDDDMVNVPIEMEDDVANP